MCVCSYFSVQFCDQRYVVLPAVSPRWNLSNRQDAQNLQLRTWYPDRFIYQVDDDDDVLPQLSFFWQTISFCLNVWCVCVCRRRWNSSYTTHSFLFQTWANPRYKTTFTTSFRGAGAALQKYIIAKVCSCFITVLWNCVSHQAPLQIHATMIALDVFQEQHNRLPNIG